MKKTATLLALCALLGFANTPLYGFGKAVGGMFRKNHRKKKRQARRAEAVGKLKAISEELVNLDKNLKRAFEAIQKKLVK